MRKKSHEEVGRKYQRNVVHDEEGQRDASYGYTFGGVYVTGHLRSRAGIFSYGIRVFPKTGTDFRFLVHQILYGFFISIIENGIRSLQYS